MSTPRHPNAVVLPEPIKVSPLLRAARWSALGLGIVWGVWRFQSIKKYHADIREFEHEKAIEKAQKDALHKKWSMKAEMRDLMQQVGIPFEQGKKDLGIEELYADEKTV
ncbi:Protein R04F11.2 [Aphelenchoides avenae]|nr:Protein R04F11.2 [Aphelenchus avenae]